MFEVILYQPEIPQNTGAIMRLCAATNARLHLIEPLGFNLSSKHLKRSAMDYWQRVSFQSYQSLNECLDQIQNSKNKIKPQIYACTTKAKKFYYQTQFAPNDILIFGPETRGLPKEYLAQLTDFQKLRIPMIKNERSLNLAMSVGIVIYEGIKQNIKDSVQSKYI